MHKEVLSDDQVKLLPLLKTFKREYYLAGGTAIALYIGHRSSIDFDLFKNSNLNTKRIITTLKDSGFSYNIILNKEDQINLIINNVKFTFFEYPFRIEAKRDYKSMARMPELRDLAAMKAYALGRRSKWKDYVDLYFILKYHYSFEEISASANKIYGQFFSEKMFRAQLAYFDDVDYSEEVEFMCESIPADEVRLFLTQIATEVNL